MTKEPFNELGRSHALSSLTVPAASLRELNLSFARNGEDLLLRGAFKMKLRTGQPGLYVDLGCYHPINISNTYLFYCYGWSGVCIDANHEVVDPFTRWRPRDRVVVAAISDEEKSVFYATHKSYGAMNKIMETKTDFEPEFNPPAPMQTRPLSEVLDDHVPEGTQIDFFSIDIEDSEMEALKSNDWDKYRPHAIIMENHGLDLLAISKSPTVSFLLDLGYRLSNAGTDNVFLVCQDFEMAKREWAQLVIGATK